LPHPLLLVAALAAVSAADTTKMTMSMTPVISPAKAMEAVSAAVTPSGITMIGTIEPLKQPPTTEDDKKQENWLGGAGWRGGWGGLGGWGGFGPYRFGYACGGLSGWAYPLGFWNTFGAGLYGGGCGLGLAYGGLYYC
jgi:hypothetical protein